MTVFEVLAMPMAQLPPYLDISSSRRLQTSA